MQNKTIFDLLLNKIPNYPILPRVGIFVLALSFLWFPFAAPVYLTLQNQDANLTTIITMAMLFIAFLILVKVWGKYVYKNNHIFRSYGLVNSRRNFLNLVVGFSISFAITWSLFGIQALFGWVTFNPPTTNIVYLLIEGFLSALFISFAEELFFRGWLLSELEKDFSAPSTTAINGFIFALLHFIKPLDEVIRTIITFPALFVLGFSLVWAKRKHKNLLGICIGFHGGFVWGYYVLNVGEMLTYTDVVPQWITGINQNPIAGLMGLGFLTVFALFNMPKQKRMV
ncbi:Metal-dependent membrane protease, abortive infection protein [Cyanobacterium sp. HL-69]|uniref:CPBP family intramembrane glutamic endopeptidase n=1 Tax=Cyanobacterium sp. HL-69 TaxID=2054282 RepID=UPI000CA369B6|nr:Metal-dependent membrane protease, abortive infection protein [Cyanobacterium sp. HL-69]